eukprot:4697485-Pleurochrysis_carterae.AAC.2
MRACVRAWPCVRVGAHVGVCAFSRVCLRVLVWACECGQARGVRILVWVRGYVRARFCATSYTKRYEKATSSALCSVIWLLKPHPRNCKTPRHTACDCLRPFPPAAVDGARWAVPIRGPEVCHVARRGSRVSVDAAPVRQQHRVCSDGRRRPAAALRSVLHPSVDDCV